MDTTLMMKERKQLGAASGGGDGGGGANIVFVKCECCGFPEECTESYSSHVRTRYQGRWLCGLCGEAVKDEIVRSDGRMETEEALNQHMSFCRKFKALRPPPNPTEELITAVKQLLLRSLDSPHSSPIRKDFMRSHSCMPTLDA